jgi:hypothetical protein
MGVFVEPRCHRIHAARHGCRHAALAQQVQQCGHTQTAVQVLVQEHLGQGAGGGQQRGGQV